MTLKEIAQMAGVSISTVSRVINNSSTKAASKEVQDRIWQIVRESGYSPNITARNLKMNTASVTASSGNAIGCIFARSADTEHDPFFSQISRAVEQEALRHNCIMKYVFSAQDIADTATFRKITENNVNGVAVLGRFDKALLDFLQKHYKHVVYSGLNIVDSDYDQVICDGYKAAAYAVEYLYRLGHRQIGYVGEKSKEIRYQSYGDTLKKLDLPLKREFIINTELSIEGGYRGILQHFKKEGRLDVSALFCANDMTAIGAMKALKEHGLRVPEDISIISIDDIEIAQYVSPMLTTIRVPMSEMGQMAAKLLIDRIENGTHLPVKLELPFSLAVRDSCTAFSPNSRRTSKI